LVIASRLSLGTGRISVPGARQELELPEDEQA